MPSSLQKLLLISFPLLAASGACGSASSPGTFQLEITIEGPGRLISEPALVDCVGPKECGSVTVASGTIELQAGGISATPVGVQWTLDGVDKGRQSTFLEVTGAAGERHVARVTFTPIGGGSGTDGGAARDSGATDGGPIEGGGSPGDAGPRVFSCGKAPCASGEVCCASSGVAGTLLCRETSCREPAETVATCAAPADCGSWVGPGLLPEEQERRNPVDHGVRAVRDVRRRRLRIHGPAVRRVASVRFGVLQSVQPSDLVLLLRGMTAFKSYFYPAYPVVTSPEVERDLDPAMVTMPRKFCKHFGIGDLLAILAYPEPGTVVALNAVSEKPIRLSRHERERLARIGLHLGTSFRLRRRPEVVVAELDLRGRVLHRTDDAPPSSLLLAHASRIEQARDRSRTDPSAALAQWPALVAGHLSLVERDSGRGRRYLVVENGTNARAMRALTSAELDVLAHASRGLTTKLIACALGLSASTVSIRMASAAAKIGASSPLELVRLAAMVSRDPRAASMGTTTLTAAERDVLELLQHGLSKAQIARIRSRSVRTIANEVASLLKKTNSHTRRALIAHPGDDAAPANAP